MPPEDGAFARLNIVLADEDEGALRIAAATIRELGHQVSEMAIGVQEAVEIIAREDPDLAIVALYDDSRMALDLIEELAESVRGPVIALVEHEDPAFVALAAERGIYAYAREGSTDALQAAIEVAVRRHAEKHELVEQVQRLESALERRSVIERAKGILMERHDSGERGAFEQLRQHARAHNRTVVEVAHVVTDGGVLPPASARGAAQD